MVSDCSDLYRWTFCVACGVAKRLVKAGCYYLMCLGEKARYWLMVDLPARENIGGPLLGEAFTSPVSIVMIIFIPLKIM